MKDRSKDAAKFQPQRSTQGEQLAAALNWILNKASFSEIALHGGIKWTVLHLVRVAILWVWSSQQGLVESANDAIEKTEEIWKSSGGSFIRSYQTLVTGLIKYGAAILQVLMRRMYQLMEETDQANYRIGRWLVLAVDGSRLDTPRTLENQMRFCKPKTKKSKKGKSKRGRHAKKKPPVSKKKKYNPQPVGPQVWLTLLWHVGLRMPWAWMVGPSYSSERAHFMEMFKSEYFPENTLICGDAGFVGSEFWRTIDSAGQRFLCRVGSNCRFLKMLGKTKRKGDFVYSWPKQRQSSGELPLTLRLLCFNDGYGEVYLVTNELSCCKLSDRLAGNIYRRRWGIEVQLRALKQTFGRSKLKGRTPDVAVVELNWSIMGLWMMQLVALREQLNLLDPDSQASVAQLLRIFACVLQRPDLVPDKGQSLKKQLSQAHTDSYTRTAPKKSRNYPRRKEQPRTRPPKLKNATKEEQKRLQQILALQNAA